MRCSYACTSSACATNCLLCSTIDACIVSIREDHNFRCESAQHTVYAIHTSSGKWSSDEWITTMMTYQMSVEHGNIINPIYLSIHTRPYVATLSFYPSLWRTHCDISLIQFLTVWRSYSDALLQARLFQLTSSTMSRTLNLTQPRRRSR